MPGALAGLRVAEIASGIASAYCGQLFAQAGAHVIRIEPPTGDLVRDAGPFPDDVASADAGGLHQLLNGGKRSLALDIEDKADAVLAERVIRASDLLIASWKVASRLPLASAERMAQLFPQLVYVSISPFGRTGPYAQYEADGSVLEALAGMAYISGHPDREPLGLGVDLPAYMAGVSAFVGGMAALRERDAGGVRHHFVDVSALETLAICDDFTFALYLGSGAIRGRYYSRLPMMYPCDIFACADGHLAFVRASATGRDFGTALAIMVERPELADSPMLATQWDRVLNWVELHRVLTDWFGAHTMAEAQVRADEVGIELTPVPDVRELLADEHLRARDFFRWTDDRHVVPGPPFAMSASPLELRPAPALGEDNGELIAGLEASAGSRERRA